MTPVRNALTERVERFARFLRRHGIALETFSAHLRLDILTVREAWALRKFLAISGGGGFGTDLRTALFAPAAQTIVPQTATSTVTGSGLDFDLCDGPLHGVLQVGAVSGTGPTLDVKYQSADAVGGPYTDIGVPGSAHPQVVAANKCSLTDFKRPKRWVRGVATIAGGSPSFALSVMLFGVPKTRSS